MFNKTDKQQSLKAFIIANQSDKTISTPISYQYYPVEILSKEFTKFNSNYLYKIHYLGPRPGNIQHLHKKYGRNAKEWYKQQDNQNVGQFGEFFGVIEFAKYGLDMKKIINYNIMSNNIFEIDQKKQIFYRAFEGMNPSLNKSEQYIFNSAFQGGNLDCVIKVQPNEFDLFLRIDSNSRGHLSWYYFSIKNNSKIDKIKLNICNLRKPSLLYENGMKPFVFSRREWMMFKRGWMQSGSECFYEQKSLRYNFIYEKLKIQQRYTLTFSYQFSHQDDQVFFAYCIPFTYSELQYHLTNYKNNHLQVHILGKSLAGLDIPLINISNHSIDPQKKKTIVITGRVHPGQSNSSHVVNGFIKFLLSTEKAAAQLRNNNNFFIIPMLNPDGVILGNTRTSLSGYDLNRTFDKNNKQLYPQIYYLKGFLQKLHKKYKIVVYLDFHGHSRKKSTFAYGPNYPINHSEYEKSRIFAKLIEKFNNKFRFHSSSFMISEDKLKTARAVMLNQFKIIYAFTIQSSIGLYYDPNLMKTLSFTKQSWHEIGGAVANGLNTFILLLNHQQQQLFEKRQQKIRIKQKIQQNRYSQANMNEGNQLKNLYNQLIEEIKKQAELNFDNQISSDDHNSSEDMDSKKQNQLNHFYKQSNQKYHKNNKTYLEDLESWSSSQLIEKKEEKPPHRRVYQTYHTQSGKKTPNITKRTIVYSKKSLQKDLTQTQKQQISQKVQKNILIGSESKQFQPIYKQKAKSILRENYRRERYNLATTTLLPCQGSIQGQILPKSIKMMRSQMKKGRNLISCFQQSKKKYDNQKVGSQYLLKEERRYPFLSAKTQLIKSRLSNYAKHISIPDDNVNYVIKSRNGLNSYLSFVDMQQIEKDKSGLKLGTGQGQL